MSINRKQLGDIGEKIAADFLKKKGYKILDRNYFEKSISGPGRGEVDIVAKKDDTISFIEVKTLSGAFIKGVGPEEKVNFQKQRKLIRTAQSWLIKNKIPLDTKWQIDIIAIKIDLNSKKAKLRHLKNVVY